MPLSTQFANVTFSETSFTVQPGQTQGLTVYISPPTDIDPTTFPVFSGFIQIANANESYQVTYLGVAGALEDVQVVDNTDIFFGTDLPVLVDEAGNFQTGEENYTFVGDDFPSVLMRLAFGTPLLRLDLVDPNAQITTTLNRRDTTPVLERDYFSFPKTKGSSSFSEVQIIGPLVEQDFLPRNSDEDVSMVILSAIMEASIQDFISGWL